MKTILFVCTGNLFRSVAAQYSFNKLNKNTNIIAESAGTSAIDNTANPLLEKDLIANLKKDHLNVKGHKPRRINKEILEKADLIVAMSKEHKECIKDTFGKESVLFKQVCYGKDESVDDMEDIYPNWKDGHIEQAKEYLRKTIDYLDNSMPKFIENMDKFF